jgi:hypothetical protein
MVLALFFSGVAQIGIAARLLGRLDGYPMVMHEPGEVDGLPAPLPGVVSVVSALVPQAVPAGRMWFRRTDLPPALERKKPCN